MYGIHSMGVRSLEEVRKCDENEMCHDLRIYFSVSRSLSGIIKPNLRGVTCEWGSGKLDVYCYFDGEVSEQDEEFMIDAEGEVAIDYMGVYKVTFHCIRYDYTQSLGDKGMRGWIYRRYEE